MSEIPKEVLSEDFSRNLSVLKDTIQGMHDALVKHEPFHQDWGRNPIFENKIRAYKKLNSLVKEQKKLAEGMVALLRMVHDFEDEKLKKSRPVMPEPPRPSNDPIKDLSSFAEVPKKPDKKKFGLRSILGLKK